MRNPPRARQDIRCDITGYRGRDILTGIDRCYCALDYHCRETVEPSQSIDDLLERRELCYHIQKEGDESKANFICELW